MKWNNYLCQILISLLLLFFVTKGFSEIPEHLQPIQNFLSNNSYADYVIHQELDSGEMVNNMRLRNLFNNKTQLVEQLYQVWNDSIWCNYIPLPDFAVGFKDTYIYDDEGRIKELNKFTFHLADLYWVNTFRETYTYKGGTNKLDTIFFDKFTINAEDYSYIHVYQDKIGNKQIINKYIRKNNNWIIGGMITRAFDQEGHCIFEERVDSLESRTCTNYFNFDSLGNLLEEQLVSHPDQSADFHYQYDNFYDESNNLTEVIQHEILEDTSFVCLKVTYDYDDNGHLLLEEFSRHRTAGWLTFQRNLYQYNQPVAVTRNQPLVTDFKLYQNYPNPFNPETTIKYSIPAKSKVEISIYDIQGKVVKNLVDKKQNPGEYTVIFDASDFASGVYIYRLKTDNFTTMKKCILIK